MTGKFVWARFWAKQIDVLVFGFVWAIVSIMLAPCGGYCQYTGVNNPQSTIFWAGLLVYPFWEAMMVSASGTSFGRVPFGLRIRDAKTAVKPSFGKALKRTWRCWIWGYGFGIPVLSWLTMLSSKGYLDNEAVSSWDEIAGTEVVRGHQVAQ